MSVVDCYTHMQLADFLTKPLGSQQFNVLVNETMGYGEKKDLVKFARRHWEQEYEYKIKQQRAERFGIVEQYSPQDAQGGMLNYVHITRIERIERIECIDVVQRLPRHSSRKLGCKGRLAGLQGMLLSFCAQSIACILLL